QPCLPITLHTRDEQSIQDFGDNALVQWKPDSSMLVVSQTQGLWAPHLDDAQCSALNHKYRLIAFGQSNGQTSVYVIDEHTGGLHISHSLIVSDKVYTAPQQTQGLWAPHLDDAQCSALNHKYRLIAFGQSNGQTSVYVIDEHTGGLHLSHSLIVSDKVYTGELGSVSCMRYTPDGRALALAWSRGGFSLWSTFGSLLMCSLAWDYGLRSPDTAGNPLLVRSMEWGAEGYQLCMIRTQDSRCKGRASDAETLRQKQSDNKTESKTEMEDEIILYSFVKSVLATNPTMSHQSHLFLQGEDKLYINFGSGLSRLYQMSEDGPTSLSSGEVSPSISSSLIENKQWHVVSLPAILQGEDKLYINFGSGLSRLYQMSEDGPTSLSSGEVSPSISSSLIENKQWHVVSLPATYAATNWPIRLAAIDSEGKYLAVAGRCGIAHYSLLTRKWKLFGNETQEKDMVVFGGLLWYAHSWIVAGCYSIPTETDEIRFYPKDLRLCNDHMISIPVSGQVFLLENLRNRILTFTADCRIYIYNVEEMADNKLDVTHIQSIDVSGLCVHPACIVSITLTSMRPESRSQTGNKAGNRNQHGMSRGRDSFVMNVSGRLLLVHQFDESQVVAAPTVLASNVETIWVPSPSAAVKHPSRSRPHLTEALWLYCGVAGMRVWLPLFPRQNGGQGTAEDFYMDIILQRHARRLLVAHQLKHLGYFAATLDFHLVEWLAKERPRAARIDNFIAALKNLHTDFARPYPHCTLGALTGFEKARQFNVKFNPDKFQYKQEQVKFLGKEISKQGVRPDKEQVAAIVNMESPKNKKELMRFLGMTKYLAQFIPKLSELTAPLRELTKDRMEWTWSNHHEDCYVRLKNVMATRPVLRFFDASKQLVIETDASKDGLGYHAWEIARACTSLPYFPHSLELLLHEVLEEEATSKEPIPDAQLPSVIEFIQEFPVYLSTIVQCARKTEIALWGYLFGAAGKPKDLFQQCLLSNELDTAASYLIILQNLESSSVSRQYATLLLDATLDAGKWDLAKDLVRFLKAIDPNDIESPRTSVIHHNYKFGLPPTVSPLTPPLTTNEEDLSMLLEFVSRLQSVIATTVVLTNHYQVLDQLSKQITSRGTSKAEVQLRYLLQIFMEAGCLDWTFIIAVLLRDAMAIHRISNAARSHEQSYEAVLRLRDGFVSLCQWSNSECLGYKPFMIAVQAQLTILNKLLTLKHNAPSPNSSSSTPLPRSRTCSTGATNADSSGCTEESLLVGSASSAGECEQTGGEPSSQEPGGTWRE
ncbi:RAB6A-GEF complex partner protein 1, partial [Diaphorina citri]|uniref:Protein RIC1 homolog n=1 Tax=Diaphorina citri TaxID=121845 RepID=A0A3Q0IVH9_DIACI